MVCRPPVDDVTHFTLEVLDDIDALRLRYNLSRMWEVLPPQVQAVRLRLSAQPDEVLVLDLSEPLPAHEQDQARLVVVQWLNELLAEGLVDLDGFGSERATHTPLDAHQALVDLCALSVGVLRRYVQWVSPRRRVRLAPGLQDITTAMAVCTTYNDYLARWLRRVVARHALSRLLSGLEGLGAYPGVELTPDGHLRWSGVPVPEPTGVDLRVVYRVLVASEPPQRRPWLWPSDFRSARRYSDPLHAAVAVLEVLRELVRGLTTHERLQVLEELSGWLLVKPC